MRQIFVFLLALGLTQARAESSGPLETDDPHRGDAVPGMHNVRTGIGKGQSAAFTFHPLTDRVDPEREPVCNASTEGRTVSLPSPTIHRRPSRPPFPRGLLVCHPGAGSYSYVSEPEYGFRVRAIPSRLSDAHSQT